MSQTPPIRIFISYAHRDRAWLEKLKTHLGWFEVGENVGVWNDDRILAGSEFDEAIKQKLGDADLVVALISADFGASSYCLKNELAPALGRHERNEAVVVPVLIRPCVWKRMPIGRLEMLPKDENAQLVAVSQWEDEDVVFTRVAERIGEVIDHVKAKKAAAVQTQQELEALEARSAATGIDLALYLKRARKKWEAIDLTALATPGAVDEDARPTLGQLFVPQDCRRARPPQTVLKDWLREQGLDPEGEEAQRELLPSRWEQEQRVPALDLLGREDAPRLVLLGDPGSGKSSLARYVLLELLRPPVEDEARPWRQALDGYVPFLVELRDLVARDAPGWPCAIPAYLADLGSRLGFGFSAEAAQKQLRDGRSLLIVDGLDEIFDPARRRDLVEEIVGLETLYPSARILVTSRIAGFEAAPFERAGFALATLDDLSPEQVEGFAEGWFDLVFPEDAPAAARAREDLLDALNRRPQLRALAGNPLMMTLMATAARHKRLGRSRTEIDRQALDLLCYGWDYRRGPKLPNDSSLIDLDPADTLKMLRGIAWRMQEGEALRANAIQESDLKAELRAFFDSDYRFDPAKAGRVAAEMIRLLAERTWIVTPRGPALFGFVHRTFLEYLCAFELNERFRAQTLSLAQLRDAYVLSHMADDSWHEVIRLLIGQLPAAAADEFVQAVCPSQSSARDEGERLGLAWQCIAEVEPANMREMSAACERLTDATLRLACKM